MENNLKDVQDLICLLKESPPIGRRYMRVIYKPLVVEFVKLNISAKEAYAWMVEVSKKQNMHLCIPSASTLRDWMTATRKQLKEAELHLKMPAQSSVSTDRFEGEDADPPTKDECVKGSSVAVPQNDNPGETEVVSAKKPRIPGTSAVLNKGSVLSINQKYASNKAENMTYEDCQVIFPKVEVRTMDVENTVTGKINKRVVLDDLPRSVHKDALEHIPEEFREYYWLPGENGVYVGKLGKIKTHKEIYGYELAGCKEYRE